jgi:hypothetical protein
MADNIVDFSLGTGGRFYFAYRANREVKMGESIAVS